MKPVHPILARILPYLMIAFILILFVLALFIFSYVFIFALIVGFILFVIGFVRAKFFGHKTSSIHEEFIVDIKREKNKPTQNIGRVIEHDEDQKTE